jgi:streptomycin 3"-adenylyltransferase
MFDPIQWADITAALLDELPAIVRWTETDTTNALLTLARIWCTVSTARFYSKSEAAEWALGRLPAEHQAVLLRARTIYLGDEQDRWKGLTPRIEAHTDFVVAQIQASARR